LEPTESINPCAASPIFVRPSPIAPSELIPGIEVGGTAPKLARFVDVELVLTPVSELNASDRGTRSHESRCSVLTEGDGDCSDSADDEHCCALTTARFGRAMGSLSMSAFSSATEDADDCERRVPAPVLAVEPDVVVVVDETELEAA
jgi:hypothetical protein